MRNCRLLGLLLLTSLLLIVGRAQAQEGYKTEVRSVDNSNHPRITVYVTVKNATGAHVPDLQQDQFSILEDGQPARIVEFKGSGSVPITTVLVIDRSGSMQGSKLVNAKLAAVSFIDQMRPIDTSAVMAFSDQVAVIQPFTDDKATLRQAIDGLGLEGGTAWYDAVWSAYEQIMPRTGRRSVVFLSDGMDNREIGGWRRLFVRGGSQRSFDDLLKQVSNKGVPTYVFGVGDRQSDSDDGIDEPRLQRLAEATGGSYHYTPQPDALRALYLSLAGDFQKEYAITYETPRRSQDGTRRQVQVTVKLPGSGQPSIGEGKYLEPHVLNLRANLLVGLFLLAPLLVALVAPLVLDRASRRRARPALAPIPDPEKAPVEPPRPEPPPQMERARQDRQREEPPLSATATCAWCGQLLRPDAKFCRTCGRPRDALVAGQTEAPPPPELERPAPPQSPRCPHCGRSVRPGVKYCAGCGQAIRPGQGGV